MRFDGKVAIVTGGASGIGLGVVSAFAAEGAAVLLVDRDERGAQAAEAVSRDSGCAVVFCQADVGDTTAPVAVIDRCSSVLGEPDILVNNAGILRLAPALETPVELFDEILRINLRSVFLFATEFARRLRAAERGGRIVNVSSIHAVLSEPNACAYTTAKAGIEGFSRTLASELAPYGITVNCVRPGATWSALSKPLYTPEVLRALDQRIPMRQIAQPADIAAGILHFASDAAAYSTGTTLDIDGGYIMDGSLPDLTYTTGSDAS